MQTVKNILVATRAYLATLAPSRNAALFFQEHTTNLPFEKSPVSMTDGFEIVDEEHKLTQRFGITGSKRGTFMMRIKLGHADVAPDKTRQEYVARDVARLADLIEAYTYPTIAAPDAIDAVFFESAVTNKNQPNWWITTLTFMVNYVGPTETS